MAKKIVILEDNEERRQQMGVFLRDRFYTFESVFFSDSDQCIRYLDENLAEVILICLDHDLELIEKTNGQFHDPGTGRAVAEVLAKKAPPCPVVFHSTNSHAVEGMKALLEEAGWTTFSVTPWGGTEWIKTSWYPTVRKALLGTAKERSFS